MSDEKKSEGTEVLTEGVVTKYMSAAQIANNVLKEVIAKVQPGVTAGELATFGDDRLLELSSKAFKKDKETEKGIAMPTCISVNNIVCHFSPLRSETDITIADGDVVKIDLGAHIDGYIASVAHTVVVGASPTNKVTGAKANVVLAAHYALEATLRQLFPHKGLKNTDLTGNITRICKVFETTPIENMLSHQIGQFDLGAGKEIIQNPTDEQAGKIEKVGFEENEVYIIDLLISTGTGKAKAGDYRTTVYKKAENLVYQLKMKNARTFFSEAQKKYGGMPFSIRGFENEVQAKVGVVECERHGLLQPYPVYYEKEGEIVAQFKTTALITSTGILKITGVPLDLSLFESTHTLDKPTQTLINESLKLKKKKLAEKKDEGKKAEVETKA
uniref:Peptidase_M24 domain-containing protein n=1 Tax=Panagrellus redivivus TaxID=6233 RepID=A0A7E4W6W0_PANRE